MIHCTFDVKSADPGYLFRIDVEGCWEERCKRPHHDPESVAISYVIDQVARMACSFSLLEHDRLQHKANSLLGQRVGLLGTKIRIPWSSINVHALSQDVGNLLGAQRHRVSARLADEEARVRIDRIIAFRDSLREDPTLALAQMLLETPANVSPETLGTMDSIAKYVAAYAPGAGVVAIAQLIMDFTTNLKPDAKEQIADRLCSVLAEFGGQNPAERIRASFSPSDGSLRTESDSSNRINSSAPPGVYHSTGATDDVA